MTDTPEDEWRYSINYGPEGEANYAFVYDGGGDLVSNLRIHHAIAVVEQMNARAAQAERMARLRAEAGGLTKWHLDNWSDAAFREHIPAVRATLAYYFDALERVVRERDEAWEANRKLHRRLQPFEGMFLSFKMSFNSWSSCLFRTQWEHPREANRSHADFLAWTREIDKEYANRRAESAEAKLAEALADRAAQAERMARMQEALRVFARIADIEDYLDTPDGSSVMVNVSLCRAARRALSQEGSEPS